MKRNNFLKALIGLPFVLSHISFASKRKETVTHFTPEMLKRNNFGLFIIDSRVTDVRKNPSYAAGVAYKLGYNMFSWINLHYKGETTQRGNLKRYGKINFLTDGLFLGLGDTVEEVCDDLNNNPLRKFRLMTKDEVIFLITHRDQGFL
jgi:hypothetical protein